MRILALGEDLWHSSTLEQWIVGSLELELDLKMELGVWSLESEESVTWESGAGTEMWLLLLLLLRCCCFAVLLVGAPFATLCAVSVVFVVVVRLGAFWPGSLGLLALAYTMLLAGCFWPLLICHSLWYVELELLLLVSLCILA